MPTSSQLPVLQALILFILVLLKLKIVSFAARDLYAQKGQ